MNKIPAIIILSFIILYSTSIAQNENVRSFITEVSNKAIKIVTTTSTSTSQKKTQVKHLIIQYFDVQWMAKFVLGRHYRVLSPAVQNEYVLLYTNYLVNNYFPILMKYDNDKFNIISITKVSKNGYDVSTKIIRVSHPEVSIKYHVKDIDSSYKAVDMVVEGISTIISQRSEFNSIIQQDGINGFLQRLRNKYS